MHKEVSKIIGYHHSDTKLRVNCENSSCKELRRLEIMKIDTHSREVEAEGTAASEREVLEL